jgi:hypothetical protein
VATASSAATGSSGLLQLLALSAFALGACSSVSSEAGATDTSVDPAFAAAAERLSWTVEDAIPLERLDVAERCVVAGAACPSDEMLEADSARAGAAALSEALSIGLDPEGPAYLGPYAPADRERGAATARAAGAAADRLQEWLASGCGSDVDGVPVTARPAGCDELGARSVDALDGLRTALAGWAGP